MILVTQNKDIYEIRFPYDANIIEIVKSVPGRAWNPQGKFWSIPTGRLGFLIEHFRGTQYEHQLQIQSNEDLNVNATLNEKQNIPDIDISEYHYRVADGLKPFKHQLDTIKFYKYRYLHGLRSGFILADQPGASKTNSVMNVALHMRQFYGVKHCLVIACVNSAKYNWKADILKHTNGEEDPYILGTRKRRQAGEYNLATGSKEKLEDLTNMTMYGEKDGEPLPYFLVLNIEAIRMRQGKFYPIADRIIELISKGEIGLVALDEVHRNCVEYDTLIQTDKGLIKIGDIVKNKLELNVVSYDTEHNEFVYKPIIGWHSNPVTVPMLELIIEEGSSRRIIRCTPDHKFYTKNRGWIAASDLLDSDELILNERM